MSDTGAHFGLLTVMVLMSFGGHGYTELKKLPSSYSTLVSTEMTSLLATTAMWVKLVAKNTLKVPFWPQTEQPTVMDTELRE